MTSNSPERPDLVVSSVPNRYPMTAQNGGPARVLPDHTSAPDRTEAGGHGPANTAGTTTCYLLHFDRPYIGADARALPVIPQRATDLQARLAEHEKGQGARLLQGTTVHHRGGTG